ncbi:N-acetyltransferase family protein [Amycolatopsis thermoflava]|uniref:GNAT family N-acetyltransferase n=1 Tax=Amycolatopsis thermoflava TaxID=84480 RepID=UPI003F4A1F21
MKSAGVADLPAIAGIYEGYVRTSTATFELEPPDLAEWTRRFTAITDAGLPFLVAEVDGRVAGYAYCSPWKTRPAYRSTAENSIYLARGRRAAAWAARCWTRSCPDARRTESER